VESFGRRVTTGGAVPVYSYELADGTTRWFYLIDLPRSPEGERRQKKQRGFATKTAAIEAEKKALAAYGGADLTADGTVAKEFERWLAERELDLEETSLANYRDIMRCYIVPHIGASQLYALDRHVIHGLYKKLLAQGSRTGGPLSPTTVRTVHRVLMKALGDVGISMAGVGKPRPAQRETMGRKGVCWFAVGGL
jgi:hypothetical protein